MNANRNNMFLAIALSAMVIFAWQYFVVTPQMKAEQAKQAVLAKQEKKQPAAPGAAPAGMPGMPAGTATHMSREAALKASGARVAIDSPPLDGSIALKGAKLRRSQAQKISRDPGSQEPGDRAARPQEHRISLLRAVRLDRKECAHRPDGVDAAGQRHLVARPSRHPRLGQWPGPDLQPRHRRRRSIHVQLTDSVANNSGQAQTLYPFAYVAREGVPEEQTSWVLHQGFVGVANGSETDANYTTSRTKARRPRISPQPAAGSASPTNTGWPR